MGIKTNMKSLTPRREAFKKEITLVTGGYYCKDKLPGGKVTVFPWDSHVDEWFTEQSQKSRSQFLLYETASKVAALNGLDWKDLTDGDAMTIIMVARAITTGFKVRFETECPGCSDKTISEVAVPDQLDKVNEKTDDYSGIETITLPVSKDKVMFRHAFVKDLISVNGRSPENKSKVTQAAAIAALTVVSIGGTGEKDPTTGLIDGAPASIQEFLQWYEALPPEDEKYLATQRAALEPNLSQKVNCKCDKCSKEFSYKLDLTLDFFRAGL